MLRNTDMFNRKTILLAAVFHLSSVCDSRCPEDVVTAVFSCLANVTGLGGQAPIAGGDVHILSSNCRDGGFVRVTNCIENLFDNCHKKRDTDVLAKLADTTAIKTAFSNICLKVDVYANSSECMRAQDVPIKACIELEYNKLRLNLQKVLTADEIVIEYCKYITGTSKCIEDPIRLACNSHVADLLAEFMNGLTPPMCSLSSGVKELSPIILMNALCVLLTGYLLKVTHEVLD